MWPLQGVGQMRRNSVLCGAARGGTSARRARVLDREPRQPTPLSEKLTSALRRRKTSPRGRCCSRARRCGTRSACSRVTSSRTDLPNTQRHDDGERTDDWERAGDACRQAKRRGERAAASTPQRRHGIGCALDGTSSSRPDFYARMREALREAQANNHVAALIPMLRVREEQTSDAYGPRADAASVAARHLRADGKFAVSEPQIALHATEAALNGFQFDPESAYGAGNKAGLVRRLCPVQTRGGGGPGEGGARALCCELVDMKRRQQGDSYYYGAELDLSRVVAKSKGVKTGPDATTDADRARLRRLTLDAAAAFVLEVLRLGASVQLRAGGRSVAAQDRDERLDARQDARRGGRRVPEEPRAVPGADAVAETGDARRWTRRARRSSPTTRRRASSRRSTRRPWRPWRPRLLRRLRRARRAGRTSLGTRASSSKRHHHSLRTAATAEAGKKSAARRPPRTESGGSFFRRSVFGAVASPRGARVAAKTRQAAFPVTPSSRTRDE